MVGFAARRAVGLAVLVPDSLAFVMDSVAFVIDSVAFVTDSVRGSRC